MAALTVGGALLSSVLNVILDRMSSPEVVNWIRGKNLSQKLLERLKITLYAVQAFLNDAEKRQIKEVAVKDWLDSLKDAVYKADDLLDEVSTKSAIQKDRVTGNFLSRYLNLQDREMANRMENIIDTLESIVKQKGILGLKEIPKESMSWRITTSLVESSDIYGRDKDKEAIIKLLLDDDTIDGEISAIPIVGMGGIGKTTLAQLVYHNDQVKQSFDFQAWVCVSEEFDVVKVTKTIIQAVTRGSCNTNDLNLLQHDLKEMLSRQKFLVVLDDVWNENYNDWITLLKPFRNGVKGSKILITTRSRKVASVVQTVPSHELSLLSHEDCWLVFAKHALLYIDSTPNPTLEKIGRQVVNKCNGLPLAAQTLGGLLRGKYDVEYWNQILKSEIWEFSEDRSKIIPALRISYYYLPSCLKECFLYCSLFPQDYQFDRDEIILLWMAEHFLQPMGRKSLKEVGDEYFDELVLRSFFQHDKGRLFVMHDLMHDLATFYAGEFYFRAEELGGATEISSKTRHLSHNGKSNYPMKELLAVCDKVKHMRTFLEINLDSCTPFKMENTPCILLSQFKYLRVLSFKYFPLDSLPDSIGELIHLRYLDLSKTCIVTLPESINNLYNLQTMKLFGCDKLKMLPLGMQDLVNLRHLDIKYTSLEEMPKGMSKLKHVQFLSNYIVGKNEENMMRELGALANLCGSLRIAKLENVINGSEALAARMVDKKNINILELSWSSYNGTADSHTERDVLDKLCPHRDLKELTIEGYRGTLFPNWLGYSSFHNMTKLTLRGCRNCCMLPSLGQLPSLKDLWISGFDGLEIIGAEFYKNDESYWMTPFPSLETLRLFSMSCWQEWCPPAEMDAFPQLKVVEIDDCPMLKGDFPNHLQALKRLTISRCEQLACSLPVTPEIEILWIEGDNKATMRELPFSLRSIWIQGNRLVESLLEPHKLAQLNCLHKLWISNFSSPISFPVSCLSLHTLNIRHCRKLEFQMQHQHESSLQSLEIHDSCDSHTSFWLDSFPNLATLTISKCENMKSLVVSQSLPSLRCLTIEECPSFVSFSTLGVAAPHLEHLKIHSCPEIEGFLPPNLKDLHISHCEKLVSCLASIKSNGECENVKLFPKEGCLPASLESLSLSYIPSLEMLDCKGLAHLTSLQELTIEDCPKLKNIAGERLPASLIRLFVRRSALLGKRCETKDPIIWPKISHISSIQVDGMWIW